MKKSATLLFAGMFALSASAQVLPTPSPAAQVEQKVGVTQVELDYSRPSTKGRTIFGELVPFDKMWRLGANGCTKLTINTAIKLAGKDLAAGEYSMQAIPSENGNWVIVINSDATLSGLSGYDEKKDVMRVNAKAMVNSFTESLFIGVDNITNNSGVITIQWEKLRVDVPFTVDTDNLAVLNIENEIKKGEKLEDVYAGAANYYNSKKDYDKALDYANKSIKIKETFRPLFIKANILKKNGDTKEAIKNAEKALVLAKEAKSLGYANYIERTIEAWKK